MQKLPSEPDDIISFEKPETGAMLQAATRLADAFDRWHKLDARMQENPSAVSMEDLSAAWAAVQEAHEAWVLSR